MDKMEFKCPRCGGVMEQEGQHEHSMVNMSTAFDHGTKKWIIPEEFQFDFIKKFWCKRDGCNMRDRYTFIDGRYRYRLVKDE